MLTPPSRFSYRVAPFFLPLLLPACGGERGEADTAVSASASASATMTATATASATGTDSDGSSATSGVSTTGVFDVGAGSATATTGDNTMGCDKVDFLFIIDASGSMQDEQVNLINSFPGFISTIQTTLQAKDYHIIVVGTDNGMGTGLNSTCTNGDCSCTPAPVCCENACSGGFATTCNGFDCNALPIDMCDQMYGTGKKWDAMGNFCNLADMRRYMLDTQADIPGTFQCIANVGTYGSGDEKPMEAMGWAVSDTHNDPGGCNDGFLRDDAILVVTFITDEEDDHDGMGGGSMGEPADWYNAILTAKNGDPNAAVVLGLFGDGDQPGAICVAGDPNGGDGGAENAPRLRAFTEMFPRHEIGSVCATDYTPFFAKAVETIDTTCDEFVPPG
jgi:hypothetical protein